MPTVPRSTIAPKTWRSEPRKLAIRLPLVVGPVAPKERLEMDRGPHQERHDHHRNGAGYSTVLFAALGERHVCCTSQQYEVDKIGEYLDRLGVSRGKAEFLIGSTDETLPKLNIAQIDFALIDGCHRHPFPTLDADYIDKHLKVGGIIGIDNAEIRTVRNQCEFFAENDTHEFLEDVWGAASFTSFFRKVAGEAHANEEWVDQAYSRAKKDPGDWRLSTRMRRRVSKLLKPHLL